MESGTNQIYIFFPRIQFFQQYQHTTLKAVQAHLFLFYSLGYNSSPLLFILRLSVSPVWLWKLLQAVFCVLPWFPLFFEHFCTFWLNEMFWAFLGLFLPQSWPESFLQGAPVPFSGGQYLALAKGPKLCSGLPLHGHLLLLLCPWQFEGEEKEATIDLNEKCPPASSAKKGHSVQFSRSVVSDSLRPPELQHARPPCPSPSPGVHSDSRPLSP